MSNVAYFPILILFIGIFGICVLFLLLSYGCSAGSIFIGTLKLCMITPNKGDDKLFWVQNGRLLLLGGYRFFRGLTSIYLNNRLDYGGR